MSRISFPYIKRIIFALTLLLVLAIFLVGCGRGANSTSGTTSSSTTIQSSSTNDATNVKGSDDQTQNLLKSLDNAQKDANDASNSGDQQDTNPNP